MSEMTEQEKDEWMIEHFEELLQRDKDELYILEIIERYAKAGDCKNARLTASQRIVKVGKNKRSLEAVILIYKGKVRELSK